MKRLPLCLLPSLADAQGAGPVAMHAPLVRLSTGHDCRTYPGGAFSTGTGGTVRLSYVVGSDGKVGAVTITKSSDNHRLDSDATDCVKSWKFLPPKSGGETTSVTAEAMVTYSTEEHGA